MTSHRVTAVRAVVRSEPAAEPGARWDVAEVGWSLAGGWSCTCPARQPCPHVTTVQAHGATR